MSVLGGFAGGPGAGGGDKGLSLGLMQTLKLAWADEELRQRMLFVLIVFVVYSFGVHIPVPIPGLDPVGIVEKLEKDNNLIAMLNAFTGGGFKRLSIFALGLSPYITASIILQVLTQAIPEWKKEMQEGGQYGRQKQNRRTRGLSIILCFVQGWGFIQLLNSAQLGIHAPTQIISILTFWTAGSMFCLWLGEQITERGIGNGVSLMIFAGILVSFPSLVSQVSGAVSGGTVPLYKIIFLLVLLIFVTWLIVFFTVAQRRIPIQTMRRQVGNRTLGGQTQYLPFSVNMVGVIPIIFASSLMGLPYQFGTMMKSEFLKDLSMWLNPTSRFPMGLVGCFFYVCLIFFFTYFYTAVQYDVNDIADNLKRQGAFIPGIRPGNQTKKFLDEVLSRVTIVGSGFLAVIALVQYVAPALTGLFGLSAIGGTTLLIVVSVALETLRQIEANLLMKQYGS